MRGRIAAVHLRGDGPPESWPAVKRNSEVTSVQAVTSLHAVCLVFMHACLRLMHAGLCLNSRHKADSNRPKCPASRGHERTCYPPGFRRCDRCRRPSFSATRANKKAPPLWTRLCIGVLWVRPQQPMAAAVSSWQPIRQLLDRSTAHTGQSPAPSFPSCTHTRWRRGP